jgi:anti-sigma regulatory factor (Ser/Thr protein kinase)
MVNRTHAAYKVEDRSYFAILKKDIHALARSAHFSERKVGEIDIIVAEMVTNLVKHAGGGQLLVSLLEQENLQGIEIISVDNGPGMVDASKMLADGVSTKNTLGGGLGAMKRLSDVFQVYSIREWGTVILTRVFEEQLPKYRTAAAVEIRSLLLPKPGEQECGDGFFHFQTKEQIKLFLGDGLGHGPEAARAVIEAGAAFMDCKETQPNDIVRHLNAMAKKTRGLVGTVAVFNLQERTWQICGVGNILTKISTPSNTKAYMPYNGIIGLNVPNTLNGQEIAYEKGQTIIMCSDGLKSRWDTARYTAIQRYDLSVLAASLLKDFARNTDDTAVASCRINL